jgi:hypothetical protein
MEEREDEPKTRRLDERVNCELAEVSDCSRRKHRTAVSYTVVEL